MGKSALIVGGTSGIGKAVARLLLERGAANVIVAGRNVEKLHAAETELSAFGRVVGREVDITNQTELAAWICWSTPLVFLSRSRFSNRRWRTMTDTSS